MQILLGGPSIFTSQSGGNPPSAIGIILVSRILGHRPGSESPLRSAARVIPSSVLGLLAVVIGLVGCIANGVASAGEQPLTIPLDVKATPRPITPGDLVALRDIGGHSGDFSISPDGEFVAFQIQQGDPVTGKYSTGWFVASTRAASEGVRSVGNGGEPLLMSSGGRVDMQARWSPDSTWIAYRLKRDDQIQLWRSLRGGGVQEQLTRNAGDVSDFRWSVEGGKIFFEVDWSRDAKRKALAQEGGSGYLFDDRFFAGPNKTAPLFSAAAYEETLNRSDAAGLWVYDVDREQERPATDAEVAEYEALTTASTIPRRENDPAVRQVTPLATLGAVAWFEEVEPKVPEDRWAYAVRMATKDGNEIHCDAPECKGWLKQLIWSDSGDEIYFARLKQVGLETTFYAWSPNTHVVRTLHSTKDKITNCSTGAGRLVCLHESATTPRKIVAIDPSDGVVTTLVDPNPEFRSFRFTQVETLNWKEAHTGATASGHLVYPRDYKKGVRYPTVVVQYVSWGFLRGGVGSEYPIHPMAANGFFVLSFNRPSNPAPVDSDDIYEREKADWGEDLWERTAALSALEVIVDQLDERGLIDRNRVGITGLSDGAETVWYAMIHSDYFATAAASSGGWSPSWYYLSTQAGREGYYKGAAGLLPPGMGGDDRWKRISPEFHANNIDVPILVQVADSELVISAASIGSLMDAGKPIEAYVYPDEYHIKWQPKHKLSVYERNIDWFNFWLRGVEDSDEGKADQYARWRELRARHAATLEQKGLEYTLPLPRAR